MNDFDEHEPGTIESILKFTEETYGTNFEIFDKVKNQVLKWFLNVIFLDNDGASSIPIFVSTDQTRARLEFLEVHCATVWNCKNSISAFCHSNRVLTDVRTVYQGD